ncbi:hypothetical protein [Streptomyces sp. NPDC020742]|uniref:hypothetical protein n=1 Tax=Streptomyces sp. NPDC020742 TaxID=3154897 RepID=UPI0033FF2D8A
MSLYRTGLAEGQRQDLIDSLHRDLLIAQWPVLRRRITDEAEVSQPLGVTHRSEAPPAANPFGGGNIVTSLHGTEVHC